MATTVLYRLSSGEVRKISSKGQTFADADVTYWGVLTDPNFPDGTAYTDPSGNFRVLGYAKIWDDPDVRNATQGEIDTFAAFQAEDEAKQARDRAKSLFQDHPQWRKLLIAFADIIKDEINILRAEHSLPDRTLAQLKTAILNRISELD